MLAMQPCEEGTTMGYVDGFYYTFTDGLSTDRFYVGFPFGYPNSYPNG